MSNSQTLDRNTAVSTWLSDYGDDMYKWAYYKTSSKETAEDLVQDAFLSAHKSFASYKQGSNAKTWLFTILNNKIIDYYRSGNTRKIVSESALMGDNVESDFFDDKGMWNNNHNFYGDEESHLLDNPAFLDTFNLCIDNLPPNWRTVVVSKYLKRKKGGDIRKEMGITASNMWQMAHRAKLQLKQCLDTNWKGE